MEESKSLITNIININSKEGGSRIMQSILLLDISYNDTTENFLLSLLHLAHGTSIEENSWGLDSSEIFTNNLYIDMIPYVKNLFTPEQAKIITVAFNNQSQYSIFHEELYFQYRQRIFYSQLPENDANYLILLLNLVDHAINYFRNFNQRLDKIHGIESS